MTLRLSFSFRKGHIFGKFIQFSIDLRRWLIGFGVDRPLFYCYFGPFGLDIQWRKLVNLGEEDGD